MASIDNESLQEFLDMKLGKGSKPTFMLFQFREGSCHVSHKSDSEATYADFLAALPATAACYAVVGVNYTTPSTASAAGAHRSKMVFVSWIPEKCPRTDKMLYCMFSGAIRAAFQGIHCNIQANSLDDLTLDSVLQRVSRFEHS